MLGQQGPSGNSPKGLMVRESDHGLWQPAQSAVSKCGLGQTHPHHQHPSIPVAAYSTAVVPKEPRDPILEATVQPGKAPYRDLNGQQAFPSILGVNGELHRQAGRHTSGVEPRAAGFHLAGIVSGKHLDLEGTAGPGLSRQAATLDPWPLPPRIAAPSHLRGTSSSPYSTEIL